MSRVKLAWHACPQADKRGRGGPHIRHSIRLSCAAPYWTVLHPIELRCTLLSCAAPYWAMLHPTELRCTYWIVLHPTELRCTYWAVLHLTDLRCTLLCQGILRRHGSFRAVVHTRRKSHFGVNVCWSNNWLCNWKLILPWQLLPFYPCGNNIKAVATYLLQTFSENIQ